MALQKRPSWRGPSNRPTNDPPKSSVAFRRWSATLILISLTIGLGAIGIWKLIQRPPRIVVVSIDGNRLQTGWLDNSACPPLRYTQKTAKPLSELSDKNLQFFELDLESCSDELAASLKKVSFRKQDALIALVQGQGLTIDDRPVLLSANFSLADSKTASTKQVGTVGLDEFLEAFSQFPGHKIVALDAGDILSDPQAGGLRNQFVQKLERKLAELKDDRLWVLISHVPGEISLDDSRPTETRRLFGRALTDALTGGWRMSEVEKSEWIEELSKDGSLSLSELATYVFKRVQADSQEKQTPWLLRAGQGIVESDEKRWPKATEVSLGKINRDGRWLGPTKSKSSKDTANDKKSPSENKAVDDKSDNSKTAKATKPADDQASDDDLWIQRWKQFDQWNKEAISTPDKSLKWSHAELHPIYFRTLRASLFDSEQRDRAGVQGEESFRYSLETPLSSDKFKDKLNELFPSPKTMADLRLKPAQIIDCQNLTQKNFARARASLIASDAAQLAARLDLIETSVSARLTKEINRIVDEEDAGDPTRKIENEINSLVEQCLPSSNPMLVEALLQYAGLTPSQRKSLWAKKLDVPPPSRLAAYIPKRPAWQVLSDGSASLNALSNRLQETLSTDSSDKNTASERDGNLVDWRALEFATDGRQLDKSILSQPRESPLMASLPSRPNPGPSWHYAWENIKKEPLRQVPFRVAAGPVQLLLKLDPSPPPSSDQILKIHLRSLPSSIEALKVNGKDRLANQDLIEIPWKEIKDKRLSIEFRAKAIDQTKEDRLAFLLSTATISDDEPVDLPLRLVGIETIDLIAEREVNKNGKITWLKEDFAIPQRVIRLRPFASHSSTFRLSIKNRSDTDRSIQAQIFALPIWNGPPGRIAAEHDFLFDFPFESIDANERRKLVLIATSQPVTLAPNRTGQLQFEPAAGLKPAAEGEKKSKPNETDTKVATNGDVSRGMLVQLTDEKDASFQPIKYFLEIEPTEAHEYLEASSEILSNNDVRELRFAVNYIDADRDDQADLRPVDDNPLVLRLFQERWMCENMSASPKGELSASLPHSDKGNLSTAEFWVAIPKLTIGGPAATDAFVGLDVNDAPRVLTKSIRLSENEKVPQQLVRYEDKPRAAVRWIGESEKDKRKYHLFQPSEPRKDLDIPFYKTGDKAFFKNPKEIQIGLALDLDDDLRRNQPRSIEIRLGNQLKKEFGDRELRCQWLGSEQDFFTLDCQLSDRVVSLPTDSLRDTALDAIIYVDDQPISDPLKVIFDQTPPSISSAQFLKSRLIQGERAELSFEIEDLSGCDVSSIEVKLGPRKNAKVFDAATPVLVSSSGKRTKYRAEFKTDEMKADRHEFTVVATDRVGNVSLESPTAILTTAPKPPPPIADAKNSGGQEPPPPPITGTISGFVKMFGSAPSSTSELVVKLESKGEKREISDGSGNFVFEEVPLGKYKIVAEANYQNRRPKGEIEGEFKTLDDFKKRLFIELK